MGCSTFTIARIINTAIIWASTRETLSSGGCEQHRRRPACASAQSDQRLFIRSLESIICKLAAGEISISKEPGLKHSLSNPPPPPPPPPPPSPLPPPRKHFFHNEAHMIPNNLVFSEKKNTQEKRYRIRLFFISQTWKKAFFHTTQLTHICLTSFLWGIGKQCRTR